MHCDSLRSEVHFSCNMFQSLLSYSILSLDYVHDTQFTYEKYQRDFRLENKLPDTPVPIGDDGFKNQSVGQLELSFERAIVMVIYEKLLLGAYVSIRSLRAMWSTLPVEMWFKRSETDVNHPSPIAWDVSARTSTIRGISRSHQSSPSLLRGLNATC